MQQINLYLPEFQPNRKPLRSIHMAWGLAVFLGLLLLLVFMSMRTQSTLQAQLESDRAQLEKINAQVAMMLEKKPTSNLAALDEEILHLTQGLARRNQIFGIVANKNLGNNLGFSEHIKALGRQSLPSISLEVFSLQKGGTYVEFAGKTEAADQIPLYVQKLRSEPVFEQVAFGVLKVTQTAKAGGVLEFSLAKISDKETDNTHYKTAVQSLLEKSVTAEGDE